LKSGENGNLSSKEEKASAGSPGVPPVVTPPGYSDLWNMHSEEDFQFGKRMIAWGMNDCAISRLMGIPRTTIKDWRTKRVGDESRSGISRRSTCPICDGLELDTRRYAYLLGLYLGDGCISACPRGVYKLRITLDNRYPGIIDESGDAMANVVPAKERVVGSVRRPGCTELVAYWKHWLCLFPQHGVGPKYKRRVGLADWQQLIVDAHPDLLLRGLIQSDGCRAVNKVRSRNHPAAPSYAYPRYLFTNNSDDIRYIFCSACDSIRVSWRQMNWKTIAVSRLADVAKLDGIIGPKR
jgi:hypothetical protein